MEWQATKTSIKLFRNLKNNREIKEKELKYFIIDFKKATNLGKLYLLPSVHKCLSQVLGRPVISNCGTPTEKVSEFFDSDFIPDGREEEHNQSLHSSY